MIRIPNPQSRSWNQPNVSDLFGTLFVTKNLTFDQRGYLKLSHSPRAVITEATSNFNNPAAILHNRDYSFFVQTWGSAWEVQDAPLSAPPTLITTTDVPGGSIRAGVDYLGSLMLVTTSTGASYYNATANTWTVTNISLTNAGQHDVINLLSLNALAVVNVNTIGLYANPLSATPSLITTLTIPTDFQITKVIYFNQNLYIGTQNVVGGQAAMYVWNGQGTAAQQVYKVNSNIIFSLAVHRNSVYALLGNGALERFNGGSFTFAAGFPMYYLEQAVTDYLNITLYKNIMVSNDLVLFINFSNIQNAKNALTYQPDGLWCYDEEIGLYHRYSNTNSLVIHDAILTTDVDIGTDTITVTSAPSTGTEVFYESGGGALLAPLVDEGKYYVIRVDATHIKLAETFADAIAGITINLTSTGSNFQDMIFFPNIDYGQFYANRPTAVQTIDIPTGDPQYGTDVMWGTEVNRRNAQDDYATLMTASNGTSSRGYFITPKILADDVTMNYDLLNLKFLPFTSELDKIIIKTRTNDDMRDLIDISTQGNWNITWTSSTSFTVSEPFDEWALAQVGDEVEILQGAGGGLLAHIVSITEAAGTYTVTLDDSYLEYASGDIGKAVFRNWKKFITIEYGDSNANQHYLAEHLGLDGEFLQLKVELRGIGVKIIDLQVDDVYRLPARD